MAIIILEEEDYKDVHDIIHDWLGLDLTQEQVKTFLDNERSIVGQIAQYGATDTPTREEIMRAIVIRITGKQIPPHGTPKEEKEIFWKEFDEKARGYGFKIVEKQ